VALELREQPHPLRFRAHAGRPERRELLRHRLTPGIPGDEVQFQHLGASPECSADRGAGGGGRTPARLRDRGVDCRDEAHPIHLFTGAPHTRGREEREPIRVVQKAHDGVRHAGGRVDHECAPGFVQPNPEGVLVAVATLGTTLAPWGLAFIQSYAVDKRLKVEDLRNERIDVVVGAVLTGVIGLFIVVPCAATLHVRGISIKDAGDAARALEPLAGNLAATLFGFGFVGAALLAAAIVPLSTAYSVSEAFGAPSDVNDSLKEAPLFYASFVAMVVVAAALVLIPGAPLVPILFLSQALNAVLLLVLLPFMRRLARDPAVMGTHVMGRPGRLLTGVALVLVAVSVGALAVLSVA
jgi:hypothetical protein